MIPIPLALLANRRATAFGCLTIGANNLVYNDERQVEVAPLITMLKFTCLTLAYPVTTGIQIGRMMMLLYLNKWQHACKAILAIFAYPIIGFGCMVATVFGMIATAFGIENNVYIECRRIYALFEQLVNSSNIANVGGLPSYATHMGKNPEECALYCAPCFQPLFRHSNDAYTKKRMEKIFPFYDISNVTSTSSPSNELTGITLTGSYSVIPKYEYSKTDWGVYSNWTAKLKCFFGFFTAYYYTDVLRGVRLNISCAFPFCGKISIELK